MGNDDPEQSPVAAASKTPYARKLDRLVAPGRERAAEVEQQPRSVRLELNAAAADLASAPVDADPRASAPAARARSGTPEAA